MKLLSRDGGRLVFHLTPGQHHLLRLLLRLGRRTRRADARLSRADAVPESAAEQFEAAMADQHRRTQSDAERWLRDPAHCPRGRGGSYGLTLTLAEAEAFLQAVNATRVAAWEALGRPDFEMGESVDAGPSNRHHLVAMGLAGEVTGILLEALDDAG